jgi:hypothetical protein
MRRYCALSPTKRHVLVTIDTAVRALVHVRTHAHAGLIWLPEVPRRGRQGSPMLYPGRQFPYPLVP